ncbi:MAG: HD domain-containing protein, partial [Sphingobacteriales bacterium]
MTEQQFTIIAAAQERVKRIFHDEVDPKFVFHNLGHTQQVVAAAQELGAQYPLSDEDHFVLQLAAWFHDTGFSSGRAEEHEKESIRRVTDFLQQQEVDAETIQRVSSCIQATHMPQSPLSIVEKILCDADLYHLGGPDFEKMSRQLRTEQEAY